MCEVIFFEDAGKIQNLRTLKNMRQFMLRTVFLMSSLLSLTSFGAVAVEPDEMLSDPKLEARAREVSLNLRCLVCQNQSIDDSNAELAKDLRILVRERITKGDSNEQVMNYLVDRYGEFVLLKPRLSLHTMILWFGPLALLLLAGGYFYMNWRTQSSMARQPRVKDLSSEEKNRLAKLMKSD
jgi:cytochrome c-type biogenesis protein CcmH